MSLYESKTPATVLEPHDLSMYPLSMVMILAGGVREATKKKVFILMAVPLWS